MKKVSKSLTIFNIISLILVYVLLLNKMAFIYSQYILTYLKIITIFVGISAIACAIIEFKNKNFLVGILNIVVIFLTLPISFLRNSNYTFLFVPLIFSIANLILLIRLPDNDRLNVICIIALIICTLIEITCISIPIYCSNSSIHSFERSLSQIEQLNAYNGQKVTDFEGYTVILNGKKIRLEHKHIGNETIFSDINGNELFRIKNLSGISDTSSFINYIIAAGKYGITIAPNTNNKSY